ncbi:hypothetical protein K7I13_11855 [Brucepastera parasyntrophica]|uniref:PCI domain-containing protein n=1 Tax=Brucepastera parasyntrophica TaxID=2880008 RepID=UPI00210EF3EA|nr:hypothetical protein [Brucepastera parasyntrophica]ULQ59183.1 hypothetical protein K7I13_11855 [Brucepastera parasyntrophica]
MEFNEETKILIETKKKIGRRRKIIGVILMVSGGVLLAVWVGILLLVVGIFLFGAGCGEDIFIKTFKTYYEIFSGNQTYSISQLAEETKSSEKSVKSNLNNLIRDQYFPGAYIDEKNNLLVLRKEMFPENSTSQTASCRACGAPVETGGPECAFCGTPFK